MARRRAAVVTAGVAAAAVAAGFLGRAALHRKRAVDPEAHEPLSELPPDDLGPVASYDGTELAVRAAGDPKSPMIVFVHGFSLDMTTWHYQWKGLSDRYRCVLFDQRAHGRSGSPQSRDYGVAAMGKDLAAVLDRVAPKKPVLLTGHSMGGMAMLALAEVEPERFGTTVAGAVFVNAAASGLVVRAVGSLGSRVQGVLRARVPSGIGVARQIDAVRRTLLQRGPDLGHLAARLSNFGPDASPHIVDYVAGLAARAPVRVWTDGLADLMDLDLRHFTSDVRVPSLVVVGEHDRVTPISAAHELVGLLPEARMTIVPDAGHQLMLEQHERFNELLASFAAEVFGGRGKKKQAGNGKRS